jgi:nitrogen-specific signal transduction histidine kinase
VSQGKQKGTGLGLTLAWCVAREHGGTVRMVRSRPGETVFQLTVARAMAETPTDGLHKDRVTLQA